MTKHRIERTRMGSNTQEMIKKLRMERNQFAGIEDKDLRCRNIAVMILNYFEDAGEAAALTYSAMNTTDSDEEHVKGWVQKIAEERNYDFGAA